MIQPNDRIGEVLFVFQPVGDYLRSDSEIERPSRACEANENQVSDSARHDGVLLEWANRGIGERCDANSSPFRGHYNLPRIGAKVVILAATLRN
jgi:hypothetical protein